MNRMILILVLSLFSSEFLFARQEDEEEGVQVENLEEELERALTGEQESDTHIMVPPGELETTRAYQTETISRRTFDEGKWKAVVGEVNFNEAKKEKKNKEPQKEKEAEGGIPDMHIPWGGPVLRFVSYVVIISIVVLLVYFIVRNISTDLHIQRRNLEDDFEKPVENIEVIDIQSLLEKASREGNLKLAVRLYYLRLLKKLHNEGIISWKKDKTNRDYLMEIFARNIFFDEIRRLTHSYESVWYGDHSLKTEAYEDLVSRFEIIHQKIDTDVKQ